MSSDILYIPCGKRIKQISQTKHIHNQTHNNTLLRIFKAKKM